MFSDSDIGSLVYEDTDIYTKARKVRSERSNRKNEWKKNWDEKNEKIFKQDEDAFKQEDAMCKRLLKKYKDIQKAEDAEDRKILSSGRIPPRRKSFPVVVRPQSPAKKSIPTYFNEGELIEDLINSGSYSRRSSEVYLDSPRYTIVRNLLNQFLDKRTNIIERADLEIELLKNDPSVFKKLGGFLAEQIKSFVF